MNTLYYGDNLNILRRYIKDESVDLIYLDPPFNSNRNYNVLFKDESGLEADSQIMAFEDTWHWKGAASTYDDLILEGDKVSEMLQAFRSFIGENQMMAYLVMMAVRLKELHRVLKPTGSLYLHCDPTASHYLKILLDTIFGAQNFKNAITWKRSDAHNDAKKQFGVISDHLLFYSKSNKDTFNPQHGGFQDQTLKDWYLFLEFPNGSVRRMTKEERETQKIPTDARRFNADNMASPNPRPNLMYVYKGYSYPTKGWRYSLETMTKLDDEGKLLFPSDPKGRIMRKRYLDEQKGAVVGDVWTDISQIRAVNTEMLPYPTQKPVELLERIIAASSNERDVVLDPFAGCGTTIAAAQALNRQWIGIDITQLSIALLKNRLEGNFKQLPKRDYEVIGEPEDLHDAHKLATEDRYQFQYWALSLIQARPLGGQTDGRTGKKGSDKGIDGIKVFVDDTSGKAKRVIVQVKSGHVKSGDVRDLVGTLDREGGAIGVFITLEKSTSHMDDEAASAGFFTSEHFGKFPRIQILTIDDLLSGAKRLEMPQSLERSFKQAERIQEESDDQGKLRFN